MPTVPENIKRWTNKDWSNRGEEWCAGFGGAGAAWEHALLPRIRAFLPAGHILELGPGYGVWSERLLPLCERMTLVDVTPTCIEACRERFAGRRVDCHVNDGRTLGVLEDGSVDFVFSFNSLVHADHDVMRAYVRELAAKLRPGAFAFIHHSNLGEYASTPWPELREFWGWRGRDMTGEMLRQDCREAGLVCVMQEIIPWGSPNLIDALSLFARPLPGQGLPERVERNPGFWHQARAGDRSPGGWYARPTPSEPRA